MRSTLLQSQRLLLLTRDESTKRELLRLSDVPTNVSTVLWQTDWAPLLVSALQKYEPTVLLVDSHFGPNDDAAMRKLMSLRLSELRVVLRDANSVPDSIKALPLIKTRHGWERVPLMYFCANPSVALVQELLRIGADWVWPRRAFPESGVEEVFRQLLTSESANDEGADPILVIDDSHNLWHRVEAELDPICPVEFVGDEEAETDYQVNVADVLARFRSKRYKGAIVDLALNRQAEERARSYFMSEPDALLFLGEHGAEAEKVLRDVLGGLEVVRALRAEDPDVPIVVLSNYVRTSTAVALFHLVLKENARKNIDWFGKEEGDFGELRRWATELPERAPRGQEV